MSTNVCAMAGNGSVIEGNATPSDVLSGKTFMSENSDDLQIGTYSSKTISLINNDSTSKKVSEVYSEVLEASKIDVINYALFSYSFNGSIYYNISRLECSDDNSTWSTIATNNVNNHSAKTITGTTTGHKYYRLYSRCTGDDYSPRSTTFGVVCNKDINIKVGNN